MKTRRLIRAGALFLFVIALNLPAGLRCFAAGYALQFTNNGVQAVGIPFVPELNMYPFTVMAWIKAGGQPSDGLEATPILSKGNAQFDGWIVSVFNGDIRAKYVANSGNSYVADGLPSSSSGLNGGAVGDDQWHHVAFTVDASGGKIYVDGVLRTNAAWFGTPTTNQLSHPIYFGRGPFFGAQYVGLLDEVTLWNTALTQAQIQTNKNRALTGQEPGLIAYYHLDESVGTTSFDSAPAGGTNNGFWNNVTAVVSDSPITRIPFVQTLPASSVGGTSATLNGLANPQGTNTSAWFEWGTTTNYGNLTPTVALPAVTNDLPFPQGITGLAAGTTYHFRGVASNSFGMAWGTNVSFTTLSGPSVTTLPASGISVANATLNGTANPNGSASSGWFEWGTTTNYGNTTAPQVLGNGGNSTNFSQSLGALGGGVTYHFRAAASNVFGVGRGVNQSFTTPLFTLTTNFLGVYSGSAVWGDYDNDGRLDFFIIGITGGGGPTAIIWRNTGNGFAPLSANMPGVQGGSAAWGDYDNDGRLDLLVTGTILIPETSPQQTMPISRLMRNTGNEFTDVPIPGLSAVSSSSVAWGDYDGDGRLDFVLTGHTGSSTTMGSGVSQLWRNTGGGFVNTATAISGLQGVSGGSTAWGDYDNDGRLDFLITGINTALRISQLWRNTGTGFTNVPIAGLQGVASSSVAWADYDNDGWLDFLITGGINDTNFISELWRNTGSGFTNVPIAGLPGVRRSSVAWGDYDNDGRLDFLITGESAAVNLPPITQLWRNTGSGFINMTNAIAGLPQVRDSSVAWGDYDNDGRLDLLLTGTYNSFLGSNYCQIWRNHTANTNTPATAPNTLSTTLGVGGTVILNWNAANDAQTPANGLSYNLRIGTTPGGSDLAIPMSASTGHRRLPQLGSARQSRILSPPFGQAIYWSVQAVDTAFAGSPFAPEQTFAFNTVFTPSNGIPVPGDTSGEGIVSEGELNAVLENYFPYSPWLYMTNVAGLGGTNVTFALTNSFVGTFGVEFTTNLVDWNYLGPATPRYLFTDTNAPASPQRSYRLRWP